MTPSLARRMTGLDVSGIRKMFEMAPGDAINLGIGEPDAQPPGHVVKAYQDALAAGHNKYGPSAGLAELRSLVAERARAMWPEASEENVVLTSGSTQGLFAIMLALIDEGDEVLCPDPGFVLYAPHVRLSGGSPVFYRLTDEHGFRPDVAELERLVTRRTKALVVNSPSNPTGGVLRAKDVDDLVAFAERHGLVIVSDEVYDRIVYEEPHHTFLGKYEDVVYLNSFSKTFAMTGWRLGWSVAKTEWSQAMRRMTYHMVACPSTPAQKAAIAALTGPQDFVGRMVKSLRERRDLAVRLLSRVNGFHCANPGGAFYAFPRYEQRVASKDLAMKILEAGVVSTPGDAFGDAGESHLRVSYAVETQRLKKGLDILAEVVSKI